MGTRGRPSAAALLIRNNPSFIPLPEPPRELSDEEALEWREIVGVMSPDHFMRGNYPLLVQMCRHIVAARRCWEMIDDCVNAAKFDIRLYERLTAIQRSESQQMMVLARSMRLTQQAVMKAERVKHPKGIVSAPWDKSDE